MAMNESKQELCTLFCLKHYLWKTKYGPKIKRSFSHLFTKILWIIRIINSLHTTKNDVHSLRRQLSTFSYIYYLFGFSLMKLLCPNSLDSQFLSLMLQFVPKSYRMFMAQFEIVNNTMNRIEFGVSNEFHNRSNSLWEIKQAYKIDLLHQWDNFLLNTVRTEHQKNDAILSEKWNKEVTNSADVMNLMRHFIHNRFKIPSITFLFVHKLILICSAGSAHFVYLIDFHCLFYAASHINSSLTIRSYTVI